MSPYLELAERVASITPTRKVGLFSEFLPRGYRMTTLSGVDGRHLEDLILAKVRIGTLITIYDDLADNPACRNGELLQRLYRIPFENSRNESPCRTESAVRSLFDEVLVTLRQFPNHELLASVFAFDLAQVYNANRYSELLTDLSPLASTVENRAYSPHNMGIVLAGTMDLMASPGLIREELGSIRTLLHQSQVLARLMNVMCTEDRERAEEDVTGELYARHLDGDESPRMALAQEIQDLYSTLEKRAAGIRSLDGMAYVSGLRKLHGLHQEMMEVI